MINITFTAYITITVNITADITELSCEHSGEYWVQQCVEMLPQALIWFHAAALRFMDCLHVDIAVFVFCMTEPAILF